MCVSESRFMYVYVSKSLYDTYTCNHLCFWRLDLTHSLPHSFSHSHSPSFSITHISMTPTYPRDSYKYVSLWHIQICVSMTHIKTCLYNTYTCIHLCFWHLYLTHSLPHSLSHSHSPSVSITPISMTHTSAHPCDTYTCIKLWPIHIFRTHSNAPITH